jgi:hypothetical protein
MAKRSGKLYFAVNDVTDDDKDFPEIFMIDKIGFFYSTATTSKERRLLSQPALAARPGASIPLLHSRASRFSLIDGISVGAIESWVP